MNDIKVDLNSHIREAIEQVISEQVLPTIRESLREVSSGARTNKDLTSSERHRSSAENYPRRIWELIPKVNRDANNQNRHSKENSFEPPSSDEDYDSMGNNRLNS